MRLGLKMLMLVAMLTFGIASVLGQDGMTPAERNATAELLQETNQDRSAARLGALKPDPGLTRAAWLHAQRMMDYGALTHQAPGEPDLTVRLEQAGLHCSTVAENVAEAPTPEQINSVWMHSAGHRANLLDPRVNVVGIAIVRWHGELYAVEDFAREVPSFTRPEQENQVSQLLEARGVNVANGDEPAKQYCTGEPAAQRPLPRLVMRYSTVDLGRLPGRVEQGIAAGRYSRAVVAACAPADQNGFTAYQVVILLY